MSPCGVVNCKVLGPQGPLLTNRMTQLVTYGSVGGVGGNPGPYPAPNDEERGRSVVAFHISLARSSSSVSLALGDTVSTQSAIPQDVDFKAQARRAGRTVHWPLKALFMLLLGVLLLVSGAALVRYLLPWLGGLIAVMGTAVLGCCLWWVAIGRVRDLTCPVCNAPGSIFNDKWAYFFRCPKCGRTADTGMAVGRRKF